MKCPRCDGPLHLRTSHGITAHVCQAHGAWQDWRAIHELIRRAQTADDNTEAALLEGFLWGNLL